MTKVLALFTLIGFASAAFAIDNEDKEMARSTAVSAVIQVAEKATKTECDLENVIEKPMPVGPILPVPGEDLKVGQYEVQVYCNNKGFFTYFTAVSRGVIHGKKRDYYYYRASNPLRVPNPTVE